ncbi:hypothetical protein [Sutterella wadsworthensis]|jgi:hypothetical protein|uniref:hypothetical protein n=1 Tax=Sutterella wadsworthensis TaxID=40545 RepID=UPI0020613C39|nr:MAG TPA: hypothetical protein [Caudoviricetes sp.]
MRVRGDNAPSNAFTLEEQPKKPGFFLVRFYENAQEFSETRDGLTITGWEYDEYHLELADTGSLSEDVLANFDTLLAQAKAAETPAEQGDLESRVTTLEETSASKDDVQAVWDRMAAAYNEGVNEA